MKKAKQTKIIAYKGFDKNMQCRGFQFKEGKTYTHSGQVAACKEGFHACEYPLDVFGYYAPAESIYHAVEQDGEISRHDDDSKIASSVLTIKGKLDIHAIVKASIDFTLSRVKKTKKKSAHNTGDRSAASNTGNYSAASIEGDCKESIAAGFGYQNKAKASDGNWIVLAHRNDKGVILHLKSAKAGTDVKSDTWYQLDSTGNFVEVQ